MAADPWVVLAAAAVEGAFGYPARLRVPHPVVWIGASLRRLEAALNHGGDLRRRLAGVLTLLLVVGLAGGAGHLLDSFLQGWALILTIGLGSLGLAARSLYDHVAAVSKALDAGDLPAARAAVAMIVGRDTAALDADGVASAALESLAESFNDGVVAPLLWFLTFGLAGLFAYKAVNTADSMIGHREEPYRCFGWAAARTDDLMNLIPARLAGALIALVAGRGWRVMLRDARNHASPNSGWPEAAMAGALGVQLGGPASYDGVAHDRPTFGEGPRPTPLDLGRGLGLYLRACAALAAALALGGLLWPR
ncbi:adenosylcobinamide-phosphate synthase [Phenylobacterium sp. Root77]|uniref:adenosylcobinamide-phosphate synthase CbiB n=1 Tax=unclassified Phenylobacterium TaxID=2640670 RepID=UPI0006FF1760|nr:MULTISPECIES: adenosylcobinamide-phosphate synthase CbiB [unclassified Phenylobacterium]KQW70770.1 adenosylcobinamide-phosphate synthase [Phenylobacterium sp. Root1277]KQW90807.1 adenosylcobinamide-phosphate synthase [Phenylobacterium sp. Root1290]KRC39560.1 adenosylcobinamide-phosphate synthase [Phenylobacterium sp. Root77]